MNYTYTKQQQLARNKAEHFDQGLIDCVLNTLRPSSVLDLGCGAGWYLQAARDYGANIADGVDNSEGATGIKYDLSIPLVLKKYDVVLCLEVAQFMTESSIRVLVQNCLVNCGKYVVFSAAHIGQACPNIVTSQNREYYIKLFGDHEIPEYSQRFRESARLGWFKHNVFCIGV